MTPHEILKAARELITPPEKWTQGCFARDVRGHSTKLHSKNAACFCASGAIMVVAYHSPYTSSADAFAAFEHGLPKATNIAAFNDSHSHADVLSRFDRAIAATAPQQGGDDAAR